jgi:hypothetical protein
MGESYFRTRKQSGSLFSIIVDFDNSILVFRNFSKVPDWTKDDPEVSHPFQDIPYEANEFSGDSQGNSFCAFLWLYSPRSQASRLVFLPVMSTAFEVPPVNLDAEGAALVVSTRLSHEPCFGV